MRLGLGLTLASVAVAIQETFAGTAVIKTTSTGVYTNVKQFAGTAVMKMVGTGVVTEVAFDPTLLSLDGYWREIGGSPWTGIASAGTSGSHNATEGVHPPTAGTALNGHAVSSFDGIAKDITPGSTLGTYVTAGAGSGWALVNLSSLGIAGGDFGNAAIFSAKTSGYYTIETKVGVGVQFIVWDGSDKVAVRALSTGSYALVTWRHNGTNVQVGVNEAPGASGGASSVAGGNIGSVANNVVAGANYLETVFLTGSVAELALSKTALTDTQFAGVKAYINTRYGLSL